MDMIGRTLGNYRIEMLLGSGGMGQVYRATHVHLGRPSAIKVLHLQYAEDPSFQARFLQEARAVAALSHPNIVEVFDFGEEDGLLYLVMELCPDGSVRSLLQQATDEGHLLPLEFGLDLVEQAAEGLEYAHSQGMVHRDIKPDNLLLKRSTVAVADEKLLVKISDFGLARLAEGGIETKSGITMGTPAYMSPEQCQGLELDGRSDVYSLGIVLYEVATGRRPFEVQSLSDAVYKHVYIDPPAPREAKPDLPPQLEEIILRCMAKRPDDRYGSAAKLAIAMRTLNLTERSPQPAASPIPAISITSKFVPQSAVRLTPLDHRVALAPGETRQLRVIVANTGIVANEFLVEIEPTTVVTTPAEPQRVRLDAEQQTTATLSVSLDPESRVVPGEYRVRIHARAENNASVSDTVFASAVILPVRRGPLTIQQMGGSNGTQLEYQVELFNEGRASAHYTLQASDPERALQYRFRTKIITVEPGRSRTIVLSVRERRRRGRGSLVQFQVDATPAKGPPLTATASFNRNVSRGFVLSPTLLGIVVAIVVVLATAAILMHFFIRGNAQGSTALARSATTVQTPVSTVAPTLSSRLTPTVAANPTPTVAPASEAPIVVRRVTTDKPEVALTFSLASNDQTPARLQAILAILSEQNIHATFGFRGDWAEAHPDLVKAIVAGGHQLINQTYDSQSFTGASTTGKPLSSAQRIDELTHSAQVVKAITGVDMQPYYRPPYGDIDTGGGTSVATDAAQAGYSVAVLWSIDTESWAAGRTVAQMVAVAAKAQSGDIILFNITLAGGDKDAQSLPQIITTLRAKGLSFVTVKELVGR